MELASERTLPVQLELGGKAPLVVFADADLDAVAAAAAMAATYNSGQDCTAATRLYVEASAHDQLSSTRWPTTMDDDRRRGSARPRHRHRAADLVRTPPSASTVSSQRAGAGGGRVVAGGRASMATDGSTARRSSPTSRRTPSSCRTRCSGRCWRSSRSTTSATRSSSPTTRGTRWRRRSGRREVDRGLRVAHQLRAGVTWVNDHLPIASEMPHGGRGASGFGKDMGHDAVLGIHRRAPRDDQARRAGRAFRLPPSMTPGRSAALAREVAPDMVSAGNEREIIVDRSNDCVVVDEAVFVKWLTPPVAGASPGIGRRATPRHRRLRGDAEIARRAGRRRCGAKRSCSNTLSTRTMVGHGSSST